MKKTIHTDEHKKLAERLVDARENAGLKQNEVAKILKVTQSYISKIENGQTKVDVFQLKEFAKLYKKELTYFL